MPLCFNINLCHAIYSPLSVVLWGYYPLHRGSSGTGPTAVDREQNTITDACDGIYSGLRYDPQ